MLFRSVRPDKLDQWVRDGLLKPASDGRLSEVAVARFIRKYPQEYDLARVDQAWFKAMVFAGLLRGKRRQGLRREDVD